MLIKYNFTNGEVYAIEVDDEWAAVIADMDRLERNNDKKEKRRHYSLEACTYEGEDFAVEDENIKALLEDESETKKLMNAIGHLSDKQQALIKAVYFEGVSISDYADKRRSCSRSRTKKLLRLFRTPLSKRNRTARRSLAAEYRRI